MSVTESTIEGALDVFRAAGGTLRTSEARERGVHPRTLRHLEDTGAIEKLSRGLYHLVEVEPSRHDDFVIVATHAPRLDHPPLHTVHVSEPAYSAGIETHTIGGVDVPVYSAARAVVDGFKFRSTVGTDVATDALKRYLRRPDRSLSELHRHAETCRQANVMQPYLDALL